MKIVYSYKNIYTFCFNRILRLVLFSTISLAVLQRIFTPSLKYNYSSNSKTYLNTLLCLLSYSKLNICFLVKTISCSLSSPERIKRVTLSIKVLNDLGPVSLGKIERVRSSSPILIYYKGLSALYRFMIWYLTLLAKKMSPTPVLTLVG